MTPTLIILMLSGAAITVVGGVLASWLDPPAWATPARVMAALAVVTVAATAVALAIEDNKDQSTSGASTGPTREPQPNPSPSRGASKATFMASAESLCADPRGVTSAMPNRSLDPEAFGAWLTEITSSNQAILDDLTALDRPSADENMLTDLFAQRERANDLFFRSADAFKLAQPLTGEQYLNSAIAVEAEYRSAAKAYGFRICVGSDTPGQ